SFGTFTNLINGNFICPATVPATLTVSNGNLFVTNLAVNATLEVRSGTLTMSAGVVQIDNLVITNSCGRFIRYGGTLSITATNLYKDFSAVGDSIPNGWKQRYNLDPFDLNLGN